MSERKPLIRGLVALLVGVLVTVSLISYRPEDWPGWRLNGDLFAARNAFGFLGAIIAKSLVWLLGRMALVLLPPCFAIWAVGEWRGPARRMPLLVWASASLLLLLWAGSDLAGGASQARLGTLGVLLSEGLTSLAGTLGSQILLGFFSAIGILALLPGGWLRGARDASRRILSGLSRAVVWSLRLLWRMISGGADLVLEALSLFASLPGRAGRGLVSGLGRAWRALAVMRPRRRERPISPEQAVGRAALRETREESEWESPMATEPAQEREPESMSEPRGPIPVDALGARTAAAAAPARAQKREERRAEPPRLRKGSKFTLPASGMLVAPVLSDEGADKRYLDEWAQILVDKLASFNIGGRVSAMSQGPVVTTFEFEPDSGVKVIQIVGRREDLALAMRSKELRIVAPIPGKAAVGIEVPNRSARMIRLREVFEAKNFKGNKGDLSLALGVDVDGHPHWTDLAEMPHLLVAGATGTGKSVCINVILVSLLLAHTPETLRLFLIDPKMLELSVYNDIPHLLHPVITDNKMALQALNWLVGEMERRYQMLKPTGVRSIGEYNDKVRAGEVVGRDGNLVETTLPFLVAIVEEFADLMMTQGKDVQMPIIRLAQMARAVGIHLILATQRPSVDIIDGVIKANFPSRIAFKVFSRFDSKTILDGNGAESLIGNGDMLFKHGRKPFPIRIHGAYVDTSEVELIVEHWRNYSVPEPPLELDERSAAGGMMIGGEDDLFDDAKHIVVNQGFGSTTMLQRRLRIGYTRASRLMDMLEDGGIVGPHTGSKAREVLVGPESLLDKEL